MFRRKILVKASRDNDVVREWETFQSTWLHLDGAATVRFADQMQVVNGFWMRENGPETFEEVEVMEFRIDAEKARERECVSVIAHEAA